MITSRDDGKLSRGISLAGGSTPSRETWPPEAISLQRKASAWSRTRCNECLLHLLTCTCRVSRDETRCISIIIRFSEETSNFAIRPNLETRRSSQFGNFVLAQSHHARSVIKKIARISWSSCYTAVKRSKRDQLDYQSIMKYDIVNRNLKERIILFLIIFARNWFSSCGIIAYVQQITTRRDRYYSWKNSLCTDCYNN